MLKGHTKIELTDVNTGKVETYEHDNMFTKAIYNSLNNTWTQMLGGLGAINSWHLPLASKMLGGIALFEDNIAEDENITYFPKGNPVIGYAGTIVSDGLDKQWGSRNLLESEDYNEETKTVKYVWDFGTSQGNGTIKAVGLMDGNQADFYGFGAWHKLYSRKLDITTYFSQFGRRVAEWDDDIVVWMQNGTGSVTINKSKFIMDTVTLANTLGTSKIIETHTVSLPVSTMNYFYTYWKDGDDGYWYGFVNMKNSSFNSSNNTYYGNDNIGYNGSKYIQVIRIDKTNFNVEHHNIEIPTYYAEPTTTNPIITDKYIIFPVSSYNFFTNSSRNCYAANIQKNAFAKISKTDWTITISGIKDSVNTDYFLFPNSYDDTCSYSGQMLTGQFQNIKLPNGLYQMNDIIIDDDGFVIKQLNPPMDSNINRPAENINSGYMKTILCPYELYHDTYYNSNNSWYRPMVLLFNRKKNVFLWVGHESGSYKAYIIPANCQQLMTINNLAEPVTKTATQSMKITYTVTDV